MTYTEYLEEQVKRLEEEKRELRDTLHSIKEDSEWLEYAWIKWANKNGIDLSDILKDRNESQLISST